MTGADDVRAAMNWPARHPALAVSCPRCKAPVGQRCTGLVDRRPHDAPHLARITSAAEVPPPHPRA